MAVYDEGRGCFIIEKGAEADRIHNKGGVGEYTKDGLVLTCLEALYILDRGRISALKIGGRRLRDLPMVLKALKSEGAVETRYLVYFDLRSRGIYCRDGVGVRRRSLGGQHVGRRGEQRAGQWEGNIQNNKVGGMVPIMIWERGNNIDNAHPSGAVFVANENSDVSMWDILEMVKGVGEGIKRVYSAVVDEEGDITYYLMREHEFHDIDDNSKGLKGAMRRLMGHAAAKNGGSIKLHGTICGESVFVPSAQGLKEIGVGTDIGQYLVLSPLEALYLHSKGVLVVRGITALKKSIRSLPLEDMRYRVYSHLMDMGYLPKTGLKYGTHFRVYRGGMGNGHAPYLVHVMHGRVPWREISRAVRVAHGVRKRMLFASVIGRNIRFAELRWVRL